MPSQWPPRKTRGGFSSRFGGLLEVRDREPVRFIDVIEYRGTTVDPLELFIGAGVTRVAQCAATGSGIIGDAL